MDHQSCIPVPCFHSCLVSDHSMSMTVDGSAPSQSQQQEYTTYFWSLSGYLVLKNYRRFKFSWFPDDVTGDLDIASGQTQLFRADTKWNVNQHYPHIPDHIVNNFFTPLPPLCFGGINCNSYVFLALIFTLDFIILFVFVIRIQPQTRFVQRLSFSSLDCV